MKTKAISRLQPGVAQRYWESHDLYYDDFEVRDIYEHKPGRTITDADNIWQSLINSNNHPLHSDYHFASTSGRAIANLGWKEVILSSPVFVGDTLYAESTVLSKILPLAAFLREHYRAPYRARAQVPPRGLILWQAPFAAFSVNARLLPPSSVVYR